ncbi:uncharacterized protein FIBRA_04560 [Fibroporia radiculosa]|uniref:Uncharacterized protein n=1 Tax=Fibroporia radiculosa TaxID=599839 RepID=J4IA83_9APHY|nr:uncharacterized protein FIBRA_04560 [Fibroporia radiculosa]CCM02461.1 predicted protein [Fibroporia radiculosa]
MSSGTVVSVGSTPALFGTLARDAGYSYAGFERYSKYRSLPNIPSPTALALFGHDEDLANADAITKLLKDRVVLLLFAPSAEISQALKDAAKTVIDLPLIELDEGVPIIAYKMAELDLVHLILGFSIVNGDPSYTRDADTTATTEATDTNNSDSVTRDDSKDSTVTLKDKLEYAIRLISSSVQEASDESANASVRASASNLTPPSDTSFVSSSSFSNRATFRCARTPWSDEGNYWQDLPQSRWQLFDLNWTVYLSSYATNATPVPNSGFSSSGGVVYTIATYSGSFVRSTSSSPRWFGPWGNEGTSEVEYYFIDQLGLTVEDTSGLLTCYRQLPSGGSQSGTNYTYTFDFSQTFNLFKNSGKTPFQWTASYSDSYVREKFMESPVQQNLHTFDVAISYKDYYASDRYNGGLSNESWWNHGVFDWSNGDYKVVKVLPRDNIPIHGLDMWSSTVGKANLKFYSYFEAVGFKSNTAWGWGHFTQALTSSRPTYSVPLDLTFGG